VPATWSSDIIAPDGFPSHKLAKHAIKTPTNTARAVDHTAPKNASRIFLFYPTHYPQSS